MELKGEIDSNTIKVENLSTPFSAKGRSFIRKPTNIIVILHPRLNNRHLQNIPYKKCRMNAHSSHKHMKHLPGDII
jgi:hypothetical protein